MLERHLAGAQSASLLSLQHQGDRWRPYLLICAKVATRHDEVDSCRSRPGATQQGRNSVKMTMASGCEFQEDSKTHGQEILRRLRRRKRRPLTAVPESSSALASQFFLCEHMADQAVPASREAALRVRTMFASEGGQGVFPPCNLCLSCPSRLLRFDCVLPCW